MGARADCGDDHAAEGTTAPEPLPTNHASAPVDPVHSHPQRELTVGGNDWACSRS